MSGLRQVKRERATAYILEHPDQTKEQQADGANCSVSYIAMIRAQLIADGKLAPSRYSPPAPPKPEPEPKPAAKPAEPRGKGVLLDHAALLAMAEAAESLAEGLTDEEAEKKLLRQSLAFALNPALHADTRMSASQLWQKLKDRQRTQLLGPGAPVTFEDAVARAADMIQAMGMKVLMAAVAVAFPGEEAADADVPSSAAQAATAPAGPTDHEAPASPTAG